MIYDHHNHHSLTLPRSTVTLSLSFPPSLRAAAARDTDPLFATHIMTPHTIHYKNLILYLLSWKNKLKQLSWPTQFWLRWNSLDFSHIWSLHDLTFFTSVADFKGFRQELAVKATNSLWMVQEGKLQEHNFWCKCFIFSIKFDLFSTRVLTSSTWVAVRSQVRSRWCSTKTPPMESRKSTSAAQSTWRGSPSRGCPFICM